jgi:hypothetical protein
MELAKKLLLGDALAKVLGDVEIHKISVMENNRLDRALDFVAFVTVRRDHVHDFRGDAVFEGQCNPAEWMSKLLAKFSLNHFAGRVFVVLERFADVGQQCAGNQVVAIYWDAAPK